MQFWQMTASISCFYIYSVTSQWKDARKLTMKHHIVACKYCNYSHFHQHKKKQVETVPYDAFLGVCIDKTLAGLITNGKISY